MESSKSSSKREVHSKTGLLQLKKNKQTKCQQNEGNNKDQRRNKTDFFKKNRKKSIKPRPGSLKE